MEISNDYIIRNQRKLMNIYSNLQRQWNELTSLGFDFCADRILDAMEIIEENLNKAGIELFAEDDEKLRSIWKTVCDAYKAVGKEVNGEKRIYRLSLRKYLKEQGWLPYTVSNFISDYSSRPMARLLDAGYVKAHGSTYWTLNKEVI